MAFYPFLLNPSRTNIWTEASIADRTPPMPGSSTHPLKSSKSLGNRRFAIAIRWCTAIFLIGLTGTAFAHLGDTESQLIKRYGPPTSVRPGGKFNPYFEKWMDFQREGVSISCGIHAGKCVTIEYKRDKGFNSLEFLGFKAVNHAGSGVIVERSATALKFTFKKDYPAIIEASQTGISRMRKKSEALEKGTH